MYSYGLALLLVVHSMTGTALAGTVVQTPEIDGSTVTAGLGLLTAGVLLLRARKAR
jgi:uncharacterized protein (TIGR03382 family)